MSNYVRDSNQTLAYLTDEEMQIIQIVDADDLEVVIYKTKRDRSSGKTATSKAASMRPMETIDLEQAKSTSKDSETQEKPTRHKSNTTRFVSARPMETYDLEQQASSIKRDFGVQEKPKRHKPKHTRNL
jgi:uncharacterized protein with von Willebrand factor type A (vWA) domain